VLTWIRKTFFTHQLLLKPAALRRAAWVVHSAAVVQLRHGKHIWHAARLAGEDIIDGEGQALARILRPGSRVLRHSSRR